MRYPRVLEQLPNVVAPSQYADTIAELHRLWDDRESIGFIVLDQNGIKRLAGTVPEHLKLQTPYMPPRIWNYQLQRLRQCLDDFLVHRQKVVDCFNFCIDEYVHCFGSLEEAMQQGAYSRNYTARPFQTQKPGAGARTGRLSHGRFEFTAENFGVKELLSRWIESPKDGFSIKQFAAYLSLVQYAGLAYIANFSLQRISEAASLRSDCLLWEIDEKLGRVPILCGETTKTDVDSDARWPTSPSVEVAVSAMDCIARLRMTCAIADSRLGVTEEDVANPYLFGRAFEPWSRSDGESSRYAVRPSVVSYKELLKRFPKLFDRETLRIREEDWRLALMLTPDLSKDQDFGVGRIWPLAWHQLRRTSAVNMFASRLVSDSTMQAVLKHPSRFMSLYYGKGYTKLLLNREVEVSIISAMYEVMANSALAAMGDRFVSPYGKDQKALIAVNLIGMKDVKALTAAAKKGAVNFREIRLGACTKRGACEFGGVESVSRCAGGDGGGSCADVLFDRERTSDVRSRMKQIGKEIRATSLDGPRLKALSAEYKAMENFLDVVERSEAKR
jgi:hypothetical protein